ncbi:MAG: lactate dehydrogenase [Clostridia bacterium]|nr:lactate dehydrogenase [Clostridia bacterium]
MYKYLYNTHQILSKEPIEKDEYRALEAFEDDFIYYLYRSDSLEGVHMIHHESFLKAHHITLEEMFSLPEKTEVGTWISKHKLIGVNLNKSDLNFLTKKNKYKVHVLGLGDVGGMMLSGLRLTAGDIIDEIGIFDLDSMKVKRYVYELNQIRSLSSDQWPAVFGISREALFDCDAFIFTASSRIPEVGSEIKDVRMYQYEANKKIIQSFVEQAVKADYQGLFLVVSDPVDLLCRAVLDFGKGHLKAEQIKGFGLGVMHARACYYSEMCDCDHYIEKGRAFGPHGQHLIIADDMSNYNEKKSLALTQKTVEANLDVRAVGYKPFIAPALSSAALAISDCLRGKEHHSTTYINGVYFGCRNQQIGDHLFAVEKYHMPELLMKRLNKTYEELKKFAE